MKLFIHFCQIFVVLYIVYSDSRFVLTDSMFRITVCTLHHYLSSLFLLSSVLRIKKNLKMNILLLQPVTKVKLEHCNLSHKIPPFPF